MRVAMMHVGKVRMLVRHRLVPMGVGMWLLAIPRKGVHVPVVLVVSMAVVVLERLVHMLVGMPFAHVQPDADRHQRRSHPERRARQLRPQRQ